MAIFLIPQGQVVVLAGVHFTAAKILFIAGLIRWAISKGPERSLAGGFSSIDRVFVAFAICNFAIFSLQWMESGAVIKSLGDLLNILGGYFVLRFAIPDMETARMAVRTFIFIALIMAACMINEHLSHINVFGLLGGGRSAPEVRDGLIRANGVFEHSILAGCFGATLLPLFLSLWTDKRYRFITVVGLVASTCIVITANGSTASLAYAAGILGLCLWPLRKQMRLIRWGLAITLILLHIFMHGPVWSLINKIDLTGASSNYHRYMLIDNCIRHFFDWWLLGAKNYNSWGFDMWDLSNQYVAYAVTGGLLTLAFFIAIISRSFGGIGKARKAVQPDRKQEWQLWCLGSAVFAHVVAYFGIGYFDQTQFAWFALLAIICAAVSEVTRVPPAKRLSKALIAYPLAHAMASGCVQND
ncbi:MAG TPA: hypothetical protein VMG82_02660 [Candidatus Sulfotelmatobacter sp.]|nr:hypothetical protein [Candidatus Sulfotelmatobacter sp.]